ncbi:neutral amino acid transporter B(0)-like [Antennarius striatus]|uniref:neutral amino acid transporter B(0)-like n=1 Tax=Antennarius striatus TaxID=241820 RepID=UPI0035B0E78F
MNWEETIADLPNKMGQLRMENDNLRIMIKLVKENKDLRSRLDSFVDDSTERHSVSWTSFAAPKPTSQLRNTCDEEMLLKDFQHTRLKGENRASSPINFTSFLQNSACPNPEVTQGIRSETSSEVEGQKKFLGEIAYQLDKRILSYVFRGRKRFYGFTVQNIPDKIKEASTHPLTGEEDDDYRLFLTKRYIKLMDSLSQLGYQTKFHPVFSEFVVNTYGIMQTNYLSTLETNYNNSNVLKKLITSRAPQQLQKDIQILLNCLCVRVNVNGKQFIINFTPQTAEKMDSEEGTASNSEALTNESTSPKRKNPEPLSQRVKRIVMANLLVILTVVGIIAGVLIGLAVRNVTLSRSQIIYIGFPGDLLIQLMELIIIPLVVCSVVSVDANINSKTLGRLGGWAMLFFLMTTLMASIIGVAMAFIVMPGSVTKTRIELLDDGISEPKNVIDSFLDLIRNIFPSNLVSASFQSYTTSYKLVTKNGTDGNPNVTVEKLPIGTHQDSMNILGLVVFAVMFGIALRKLGEEGEILIKFFKSFSEATMVLVSWIMWYAPFGIMFLVAVKIVKLNNVVSLFACLGKYIACCIVGHAIHGIIVLPRIYCFITNKNPYVFLWGTFTALETAFGTASSLAALPVTMKCVEENNGVSKHISRFILPIGVTVNMNGTALFQCVATIFIAQLNNIPLNFLQVITILLTATVTNVGAVSLPAGGVMTLAIILEAVGLPTSDISLILAVDWLIDSTRTVLDIESNALGAGILQFFQDSSNGGELTELIEVRTDVPECSQLMEKNGHGNEEVSNEAESESVL